MVDATSGGERWTIRPYMIEDVPALDEGATVWIVNDDEHQKFVVVGRYVIPRPDSGELEQGE